MTAVIRPGVDPEPEQEQKPQEYGDVVETPKLLDPKTDDPTVCKTLHRIWSDQKEKYARYLVECEVNERRRAGECNIWVRKTQDQASYGIYVPAGRIAVLEQFGSVADRKCQQFVAQLSQDPAAPNAIPSTGEDEDRDAAEFSTRILKDTCSESGLDANEAMKSALDVGCSHASGWVWVYTDPMGGGRQPVEVDARSEPVPHPETGEMIGPPAHVDEAMVHPVTGEDWAGPTAPRFVAPEGSLSEEKGDAALRWVPKVARQVVKGTHIRLWPHTAQDVWDADGLLYFDYQPKSVAVEWFPELSNMTDEEWTEAFTFRLPEAQHLLPKKNGKPHDPKPEGRQEDWLVLIACFWAPEGAAYPDGAYLACVGNKKVAHRGTWVLEQNGTRERRDIPWTQVRQFRGTGEHPQGKALMSFVGAGGEYLGQLFGRFEELMDMAANRKTLLPYSSTIKPQDLFNPANDVLYFQPGQKPEYEQVPEPPRSLQEMINYTREDLRESSFLQTAMDIDAPDATSGRQALAQVAQANAGLSDVNQNVNRAWVRLWRIILQCIRADYSVPQLTRITGPDGSYKVKRWTKSDLGSTRDVEIAKGSGTMLNPVQKVQALAEARQLAGIDPDEVQELMSTGLSPVAAFQDNRGLQRIRRQIEQWEDGPPAGWQPPQAPVDPLSGGPAMQPPPTDPMTGQPALGVPPQPVPPPPDPLLTEIWAPVDSDLVPAVAKWRLRELVRAQQSKRYFDLPPAWRLGLDMELRRMQQAMAPPPVVPPGGVSRETPQNPTPEKPELSPAEQSAAGKLQ